MTTGPSGHDKEAVAEGILRRLYVYNGGFLTQGRVRRILELAGYDIRLGKPGVGDLVGVWGQSPTAPRGTAVAAYTEAGLLRVEDAFLRSVLPGRTGGEPPIGLHLDLRGVHFDPATPSDLEMLLATAPLDDPDLLQRASDAIARLKAAHLSKYNGFDPALAVPEPGYVLVVDQTLGDASVRASGADRETFLSLLAQARADHPDRTILIKSHPETVQGQRVGHFTALDLREGVRFIADPVSPWHLLEGAAAVYVVSSQLGFEAILAGRRPVVFGQPFYAGWGLTEDWMPLPRRNRILTVQQLFAAAMILYPVWYDPYRDRLCTLEDAISTLAAEVRAWREDRHGWVAAGMRLWKRAPLQQVFGRQKPVIFAEGAQAAATAQQDHRRLMVWAGKMEPTLNGAMRVEDGFLRSRGLGADLIPPLSLCLDDLGIYYDPTQESRLERLIADSVTLPDWAHARAERLIRKLVAEGLSKYNLGQGTLPPGLPSGRRILVPGQVEDDASIRLGAGEVRTNQALLAAARAANPAAVILYKPHPDVEAGLRPGVVTDTSLADAILDRTNPATALAAVDEVWTITSTLGFEALLRGKRITCLGQPFYAGWGLTNDLGPAHPRRTARPDLAQLVHAVLIDYPRYIDPVTRRPCPVEVVAERLATGQLPTPSRWNRTLAKLQGTFASYAHLWR